MHIRLERSTYVSFKNFHLVSVSITSSKKVFVALVHLCILYDNDIFMEQCTKSYS